MDLSLSGWFWIFSREGSFKRRKTSPPIASLLITTVYVTSHLTTTKMQQKQQPRTKSDVEWTVNVGKEFLARYVNHARLYSEQLLSRRTFQSVRRDEESGGGGGGIKANAALQTLASVSLKSWKELPKFSHTLHGIQISMPCSTVWASLSGSMNTSVKQSREKAWTQYNTAAKLS